jgi:hypothetical protein
MQSRAAVAEVITTQPAVLAAVAELVTVQLEVFRVEMPQLIQVQAVAVTVALVFAAVTAARV